MLRAILKNLSQLPAGAGTNKGTKEARWRHISPKFKAISASVCHSLHIYLSPHSYAQSQGLTPTNIAGHRARHGVNLASAGQPTDG
jgi:hypothetical protein